MADDDDQERLNNKKQKDYENEKLWQDLQINFRLEAFRFPDNKIYGIINIIPESSRNLIKKFVLVVNKVNRIEFAPHYTHLSASGFNINRKNPSAYIEGIPINTKWSKEIKTSKICYFFFTGEVFTLSPTISFDWSNDEKNSQANLIIKWYHIGDQIAHKYILYLDDVEIQYIRQKLIDDAFDVRISSFKAGEKHTFQLAAKLNNGKETYRSDFMEFTVPNKESTDEDGIEFIAVSNEPAPYDLPAYIATKEDKIEEEFNPNKNKEEFIPNKKKEEEVNPNKNKEEEVNQNNKKEEEFNPNKKNEEEFNPNKKKEEKVPNQDKTQLLLEQLIKQKKTKNNNNNNSKMYTCCNNAPHDTFPGVEHYFKNMMNELPSSKDHDDDDDVITSK